MRRVGLALLFLLGASLLISIFRSSSEIDESASGERHAQLRQELAYLRDIEEVAWMQIDDNNVYLGFDPVPSDLAAIVNAAALKGNRALGFGVHIWTTSGDQRGWRPGSGPYYCEATGRYGKLENSCEHAGGARPASRNRPKAECTEVRGEDGVLRIECR